MIPERREGRRSEKNRFVFVVISVVYVKEKAGWVTRSLDRYNGESDRFSSFVFAVTAH